MTEETVNQIEPINCKTATIDQLKHAIKNRMPIEGIETILTHPSPHLDEVGGIALLQLTPEGERFFPGIKQATIGFAAGTYLRKHDFLGFDGFIDALRQGVLIIGVGKGPFDEHGNRKDGVSTMQIIANYLDLMAEKDNRKIYGALIDFVNFEDNNGDNLIGNLNKVNPERKKRLKLPATDPKRMAVKKEGEVLRLLNEGSVALTLKRGFGVAGSDLEEQEQQLRWGLMFFKTLIKHQRQYLEAETRYHDYKKERFELRRGFYGIIIESDNPMISQVVRQKTSSNHNGELGITIVCRPTGQFIIMPDRGMDKKMKSVYDRLCRVISEKRKSKGEVHELFIDELTGYIMNGSKTDPDTPGLIGKGLTQKDILDAIKLIC